jgi:cytochrome c oxidase subunit 4
MSDTTTTTTHTTEHRHPTDADYVKIAVILGVITALEVSTYFWEDLPFFDAKPSTTALILVLFPMMTIKFGIVVAYFMHLRFDNPLFRRVFIFGIILALAVYAIFASAMDFWSDDYLRFLRADG